MKAQFVTVEDLAHPYHGERGEVHNAAVEPWLVWFEFDGRYEEFPSAKLVRETRGPLPGRA